MFSFLYNLVLAIAKMLLQLNPFKQRKAKQWLKGQADVFNIIGEFAFEQKPIWVHVASLGEYEQVRPVIEGILANQHEVIVSFFSPSGINALKNKDLNHKICYLPLDLPNNVMRFIATVEPALAIFVKYDLWYNYVNALNQKQTPVLFVDVILKPNHWFFKWYGKPYLILLSKIESIFVQDNDSLSIVEKHDLNAIFAGDTRVDRVIDISKTPYVNRVIANFCKTNTCIAGSTWPQDETLLAELYHKKIDPKGHKLIIAPHEIEKAHLSQLLATFKHSALLSTYSGNPETNCLIVDEIGILKHIYRYGNYAYIGGGFGKGVHSLLEPAVFNLPVIHGPKHSHFVEAKEMLDLEISFQINNTEELLNAYETLSAGKDWDKKMHAYIQTKAGASKIILNHIEKLLAKQSRN